MKIKPKVKKFGKGGITNNLEPDTVTRKQNVGDIDYTWDNSNQKSNYSITSTENNNIHGNDYIDPTKWLKTSLDVASLFNYPLSVVGAAKDAYEGDYLGTGLGLIPVLGKAGLHGSTWKNAYTIMRNKGVPEKIAQGVKKYGKNAVITSSKAAQGYDFTQDMQQKQNGGSVGKWEIVEDVPQYANGGSYNDSLIIYNNSQRNRRDLRNTPDLDTWNHYQANTPAVNTALENLRRSNGRLPTPQSNFTRDFDEIHSGTVPVYRRPTGSINTLENSEREATNRDIQRNPNSSFTFSRQMTNADGTVEPIEFLQGYERKQQNLNNLTPLNQNLLPQTEQQLNFNPIPFKQGSYFTRNPQQQEIGKKEYFDKTTGKKLMKNGGKSNWEIMQ